MHDAGESEMRQLLNDNILNNNYEISRNSDVSYTIISETEINAEQLIQLDSVMQILGYNR